MYIGIEGIDFTGKSTLIELLKQELPEYSFIREPGETSIGEELREVILNDSSLSSKERTVLFDADRILTKLCYGEEENLVSDRTFVSDIAYKMADGGDVEGLKAHHENLGVRRPDLLILLTVSEKVFIERKANRIEEEDIFDKDGIEKAMRRQEAYLDLIETLGINTLLLSSDDGVERLIKTIIERIGE